MKPLFFILVLIKTSLVTSYAQTSYSCYYREYCNWNSSTQKFEKCEGEKESSLFEMNSKETMFTHTIESMQSTYYVKSKEYNRGNKLWMYTVKSDVGNSYLYIFDAKNKEVKVLVYSGDEIKMVRFYIKAIF